ncbi:MAG: VOC family protein [Candidatus Shapirobacteria bacterium]|jgi:predicted metalloenzyme YecM
MIFDNYQLFLDDLIEKVEGLGIDVAKYQLDHLGYQASSDEDYEKLKLGFEKIGKMVFEKPIGGRRVAISK